jgi:hypothetical protein
MVYPHVAADEAVTPVRPHLYGAADGPLLVLVAAPKAVGGIGRQRPPDGLFLRAFVHDGRQSLQSGQAGGFETVKTVKEPITRAVKHHLDRRKLITAKHIVAVILHDIGQNLQAGLRVAIDSDSVNRQFLYLTIRHKCPHFQ